MVSVLSKVYKEKDTIKPALAATLKDFKMDETSSTKEKQLRL
jgi:hypothetical protein